MSPTSAFNNCPWAVRNSSRALMATASAPRTPVSSQALATLGVDTTRRRSASSNSSQRSSRSLLVIIIVIYRWVLLNLRDKQNLQSKPSSINRCYNKNARIARCRRRRRARPRAFQSLDSDNLAALQTEKNRCCIRTWCAKKTNNNNKTSQNKKKTTNKKNSSPLQPTALFDRWWRARDDWSRRLLFELLLEEPYILLCSWKT